MLTKQLKMKQKNKNVVRYKSLTSKEVKAKIKTSEGSIKAFGFLMLPHALTDFNIQKYYRNELKFNDVYSKNNLPKIKDGEQVIKLDE